MIDATQLILDALSKAPEILTSGPSSLVALAARAVDPAVRLSLLALSRTLGLHESVVIAITVTADRAGGTDARREFGLALFQRLRLRARPPELTDKGRLAVAGFCLERLLPMQEVLGPHLERAISLARVAREGATPDAGALAEIDAHALALQRVPVTTIEKGEKEKLGVTDENRFRHHAGQALRALIRGVQDRGSDPHVCTTVAGEVARALEAGLGLGAAAGFTLELAVHLDEELAPEHLVRPLEN